MGKVLIIKNNNSDKRIHCLAQESYIKDEKRYYNSLNGTLNEQAIVEMKDALNKSSNSIVLMITYESSEKKDIRDVYIGTEVSINEKNNVGYIMKVHLTSQNHKRTIDSIIDKIDLDIDADFEFGKYVMMSDMESLFQELRERINANKKKDDVSMSVEENQEEEKYELSILAQKDEQAIRVYTNRELGEHRGQFQRDRERVVNCKAFRRLVDKAQIFGSEKGDYYRTRMTHSLEVNQIAKAIAYALRLNLDLTEAIALGHDLGHTPFGHQGERTLDDILSGKIDVGLKTSTELFKKRCFGGFKHNYQSAKILTQIEEKYVDFPGLNVSIQVVEGVLKHTKLKPKKIELNDFISKEYQGLMHVSNEEKQVCSSLEGQVVAIADEIAQRGHDVDDALTSGVMSIDEFIDRLKIAKCKELSDRINNEIIEIKNSERLINDKKELLISRIVSVIINFFIQKTIEHSIKLVQENEELGTISLDNSKNLVCFPPEVDKVNNYLERVVQKKVICNSEVARADYNASMIVQKLFEKYYKNPRLLHSGTVHKIFLETLRHKNKQVSNSAINLNDGSIDLVNKEIEEITSEEKNSELILEYLENPDNSREEPEIVIFEKKRILIRAITDYIAGMTDGYALEEYEKLR